MKFNIQTCRKAAVITGLSTLALINMSCAKQKEGLCTYLDIQNKQIVTDKIKEAAAAELLELLQSDGKRSESEAKDLLKTTDLQVQTTLDSEIQAQLEKVWADEKTFTNRENPTRNEAAMVIMNHEGEIKAFVGNRKQDEKDFALSENVQIGSVIKPLSAYALPLEKNEIHYSSLLEDEPLMLQTYEGVRQWPTNADKQYEIKVTLKRAIEVSKNTTAVRMVNSTGEENVFSFLQDSLGFSHLVKEKEGETDLQLSALGLGYLAEGTTLSHLTGTYAMFNGSGNYQKETMIKKITDESGTVLYEREYKPEKIISEDTSSIMNRLLKNVVDGKDGTGKSIALDGVEVIGKTGTVASEQGVSSRLIVGMTPDYIAGVWLGAGSNGVFDKYTNILAGDIWKKVMKDVTMETKTFTLSDQIEEKTFCQISGDLATKSCKKTDTGVYKKDMQPKSCTTCKK